MKLKRIIFPIVTALALTLVPTSVVYAASCGNGDSAKGQVLSGIGLTGNDCDDSQVDNLFLTIVSILSIIVGILAIIGILYAGAKYITSGGQAEKVSNAKNTLLYALVGLAVAALAQFLVHFVLVQTKNITTGLPDCASHQNLKPPDCKQ